MIDTGLVHVVYAPFGPLPFRQFVDSYRRHPAGIDHELILVFKGFETGSPPEEYRASLDGVAYRPLSVPDGGFDLGSYLDAARACEHRFLCFLNSRSVILADAWLAKLRAAFDEPGVGLAGATGNFESTSAYWRRLERPSTGGSVWRRVARRLRRRYWHFRAERIFPGFPNPHLRTNAFLIERGRFLALRTGPFRAKEDCYLFESGRRSLTRQIVARGLSVRVVGRDGVAYPPARWRESETFRAGEQRNLLVADNQTREYLAADTPGRRWLEELAWGD